MQVFESIVPDDESIPTAAAGRLLFIAPSIHNVQVFHSTTGVYCVRESIHRVSARLLFASSIHRAQVFHSAI